MTDTIQTSNGPIALNPPTMRGAAVELAEVLRLDRPEDGYTHVVGYWDAIRMVSGSGLITALGARRILADRVAVALLTGDAAKMSDATKSLERFEQEEGRAISTVTPAVDSA